MKPYEMPIFNHSKEYDLRQFLKWKSGRGGGCAFPYFNLDGKPLLQEDGQPYLNVKVDNPIRNRRGKTQKYRKPVGAPNALFVPPNGIQKIKNSNTPLLITEGEKKALKAVQEGFACVGLPGVWGFKTRNRKTPGPSIPLPQLDAIPMSQRKIFIAFDSDVKSNPKVQQAELAFAGYVRNRGAVVFLLRLPDGANATKIGLDDFLVKAGASALEALMEQAQRQEETVDQAPKPRIIHPADVAQEFLALREFDTPDGPGLRNYREEWYQYDRGIFHPLPLSDLKAQLVGYLQTRDMRGIITHSFVNNILLNLQGLCVIPSAVVLPAWQTNAGWVPTQNCLVLENGILNLEPLIEGRTDAVVSPLTPKFVTTVGLPFPFDLYAKCPHWLAFLKKVLPDHESQVLLQELFGYCLTYDTSLQKFFLLEGQGANGKGVVLRILTRLLGEANVSSLPLELFGASHDLIATLGKLVNITSEIGDLVKVAEGLLKQFTGEDLMHFNPKHRPPFSAKPTAKLIIAANVRTPISGSERRGVAATNCVAVSGKNSAKSTKSVSHARIGHGIARHSELGYLWGGIPT